MNKKREVKKDCSINIGDNNNITKSSIITGNGKPKESWINKLWWKIIIPIIIAVIAGIILFILRMN